MALGALRILLVTWNVLFGVVLGQVGLTRGLKLLEAFLAGAVIDSSSRRRFVETSVLGVQLVLIH